ncbi:hypothetical protein BGLA2_990038 [Burkholderia gladioli]|nr:hypothetical protein BGLA2_990038 [Burkholderia gladioli]
MPELAAAHRFPPRFSDCRPGLSQNAHRACPGALKMMAARPDACKIRKNFLQDVHVA